MQRTEKLINYIYFFFDEVGYRVPLITGTAIGSCFDSEIHPNSELKKLIKKQLPENQNLREIFIWVDGTEFKIGQLKTKEV